MPGNQDQIDELNRDYKQMQMMLFGELPTFTAILEVLAALEQEINSLPAKPPAAKVFVRGANG